MIRILYLVPMNRLLLFTGGGWQEKQLYAAARGGWTSLSPCGTVCDQVITEERWRHAGEEHQGPLERGRRFRLLSRHAARRRKGSCDRARFRRARGQRRHSRDRRRVRLAGLYRGGARSVLAHDSGAAFARRRPYEAALAAASGKNQDGRGRPRRYARLPAQAAAIERARRGDGLLLRGSLRDPRAEAPRL